MAEYINKETLMEFPIRANHCDKEHANTQFINGIESVMEYAEQLPTVDAEVVVRCKDCYQSVVIGNVLHCTYWGKDTDENGYCHEGG